MPWAEKRFVLSPSPRTVGSSSLVYHNKGLILMFRDAGSVVNWTSGSASTWESSIPFRTDQGAHITADNDPVPVDIDGVLYALIKPTGAEWSTYKLIDSQKIWKQVTGTFKTDKKPAAIEYNGKMMRVYTQSGNNNLVYSIWDPATGGATNEAPVKQTSYGMPGLFWLGNELQVVFASNNNKRDIISCYYNPGQNPEWPSSPWIGQKTAFGVAAATDNLQGVIAFQADNGSGQILVDLNLNNTMGWSRLPDPGQLSGNTPTIAYSDWTGLITMVWDSRNDAHDLLWAEYPLKEPANANWMGAINNGSIRLSALTLPGTHDSATFMFEIPFATCQSQNFESQLGSGVRVFDMRCGMKENIPWMVHGDVPELLLTLPDVLENHLYPWLRGHPREALIVFIKEDADPWESNKSLADAVLALAQKDPQYWVTGNTTPTLDQVRGKIQLFRRFKLDGSSAGSTLGIDVYENWKDNNSSPFTMNNTPGVSLSIQDYYQPSKSLPKDAIDAKFTSVQTQLDNAANDHDLTKWYINFTSAEDDERLQGPDMFAKGFSVVGVSVEGINATVRSWLDANSNQTHRLGMVMMDFPEVPADLTAALIQTNFAV